MKILSNRYHFYKSSKWLGNVLKYSEWSKQIAMNKSAEFLIFSAFFLIGKKTLMLSPCPSVCKPIFSRTMRHTEPIFSASLCLYFPWNQSKFGSFLTTLSAPGKKRSWELPRNSFLTCFNIFFENQNFWIGIVMRNSSNYFTPSSIACPHRPVLCWQILFMSRIIFMFQNPVSWLVRTISWLTMASNIHTTSSVAKSWKKN